MLFNGVLAGSEIALVSIRKTRIDQMIQEKRGGAAAVKRLRSDPERFLATVQIGVTVIGATAGAFSGSSLAKALEPFIRAIPFLEKSAEQVSLAIVISLISFLTLVLGELVPKSLALRSAETYGLVVSRPLLFISAVFRPVVWFLTASSNVVLRLFGDKTTFTESRLSPGEIQQLVDEATEAGAVDPAAGEIASRAIDFADLTAAQVMVPRHKVVGIPRNAPSDEVKRIVLEHGHTRMPIYEGMIDNVVGYVTVRDLLALFVENKLLVLEDAIRNAYMVPETMRAVDLLSELRERRLQIAVVVDELGAMSGIVTTEDLIEELVGDIASEHERDKPAAIVDEGDGRVLVRGDSPLRDVNRELELELPEGETWSTIAGLCLELAGRIPKTGEMFVASEGTTLEIVNATPRNVKMVRIIRAPTKEDEDDDT